MNCYDFLVTLCHLVCLSFVLFVVWCLCRLVFLSFGVFVYRLAMMGKQKDAKKKPSKGNKKNDEKGAKKNVGDVQAVSD